MNIKTNVSAKRNTVSGPLGRTGFASTRWLAGLLLVLFIMFALGGPAFAAKSTKGTFSLDFIDSDIVDVVKALATQSGVNIVVAGGVQGQTTLSLRQVTLEEALRLVTVSNGLDFAWLDVAYVIGTPEQVRDMRVKDLSSKAVVLRQVPSAYAKDALAKIVPEVSVMSQPDSPILVLVGTPAGLARAERAVDQIDLPMPTRTQMFMLSQSNAERVAGLLVDAVADITVQLGPQSNSLLITGDGIGLGAAQSFINAVDVVPPPGQAHTEIYDIKFASASELIKALEARFGKDLKCIGAPRSYTPVIQQGKSGSSTTAMLAAAQMSGSGGGSTSAEGATLQVTHVERLILMGAEYTVQKGLDLLDDLDKPSKQVKIKAMISRINRDKLRQQGVDWFTGEGAAASGVITTTDVTENGGSLRELKIGGFGRSALDFTGAIRALESNGNAKILAEPSAMTLDGRQVVLYSGQTIFYQTTVGYGISGTPILDIREVDTGVTLIVTPQVNPDGEITLTLAPTVSSVSFRQELGTSLPIIDQRSAVASVRVKNGESVVIAGLVEENESTSISKVPILGDIPLLGNLFKSEKKQQTTDELVIMVTPELISDTTE